MIVTDKDVYGQEPVQIDYNPLMRGRIKSILVAETKVLKWILCQALKREPELGDFKRLTKTTYDCHYASGYYYHLFFDDVEIGQVHFIYLSSIPTVAFKPSEIFTK